MYLTIYSFISVHVYQPSDQEHYLDVKFNRHELINDQIQIVYSSAMNVIRYLGRIPYVACVSLIL